MHFEKSLGESFNEIKKDKIHIDHKIKLDHLKKKGKKQLDISRLESIGWRPKISLESGIKMTIKELRYSLKRNPNLLKNFLN